MSTKAAEHYGEGKDYSACIICTTRFLSHDSFGVRFIKIPDNICMWCYCRGDRKGVRRQVYRRFVTMKNALDAIANVPCLRDSAEDCKCPTCFAGRVYDELFAEYEEEPSGDPVPSVSSDSDDSNATGDSERTPTVGEDYEVQD